MVSWRLFDRIEQFIALMGPIGLTGAVLISVPFLLWWFWQRTSKKNWKWDEYYRDSVRHTGWAFLLIIVGGTLVLEDRIKDWRLTPTGYFASICRPAQTKIGCRIINLPEEERSPIVIGKIRITASLETNGFTEYVKVVLGGYERYGLKTLEASNIRASVMAKKDCFVFMETLLAKVLLIVLNAERNLTQLGVITGQGEGEVAVGVPSCEKKSFTKVRNEFTP